MPSPDPPTDLVNSVHDGNCVLFVGSGISIGGGGPSWETVITSLSDALFDERPRGNEKREEEREEERRDLYRMISEKRLLDASEYCIGNLARSTFLLQIRKLFRSHSMQPSGLHDLITQIPFAGIVTTNYDNLLEDAYASRYFLSQIELATQQEDLELGLIPRENPFFIMKAHGDARRASTIALGSRDYQDLAQREPYQQFLRTLLGTKTLLLIGYGLRDPDINGVLENMQTISKGVNPHAYAVLAGQTSRVEATTLKGRYGIFVLNYQNEDDTHDGLKEFLTTLAKKVAEKGELPGAHPYRKLVKRKLVGP